MGRQAKATAGQRAEVVGLAAAGVSVRGIAERVFGDRRFRGRVERILRKPANYGGLRSDGGADDAPAKTPSAGRTATLRAAFDRRLAEIEAGEDTSTQELRSLLEVARRLDALEQLERLRALQRGR